MGLKVVPPKGTKVRMTGSFLKRTGQVKGGDGPSRWTVVTCAAGLKEVFGSSATKPGHWTSTGEPCDLCKRGEHVAVNEKMDTSVGYEDLTVEQRAAMMRHIHIGNLEIVGAPPKAEDYDPLPVKAYL